MRTKVLFAVPVIIALALAGFLLLMLKGNIDITDVRTMLDISVEDKDVIANEVATEVESVNEAAADMESTNEAASTAIEWTKSAT